MSWENRRVKADAKVLTCANQDARTVQAETRPWRGAGLGRAVRSKFRPVRAAVPCRDQVRKLMCFWMPVGSSQHEATQVTKTERSQQGRVRERVHGGCEPGRSLVRAAGHRPGPCRRRPQALGHPGPPGGPGWGTATEQRGTRRQLAHRGGHPGAPQGHTDGLGSAKVHVCAHSFNVPLSEGTLLVFCLAISWHPQHWPVLRGCRAAAERGTLAPPIMHCETEAPMGPTSRSVTRTLTEQMRCVQLPGPFRP